MDQTSLVKDNQNITFGWLNWFKRSIASNLQCFECLFNPCCLIIAVIISRSPDELGPVYSIDPADEREPSEAFGEDLDKELKQGPVKTDIAEPLSPYELNSYQSELDVVLYFCLFLSF